MTKTIETGDLTEEEARLIEELLIFSELKGKREC